MNIYPELHNFNEMYTPPEALESIIPFLNNTKVYWEACYGKGHLAEALRNKGFKVVGEENLDCLKQKPEEWDIWITNPPFNGNKTFIKRAIELGKPFIFLLRLEHLGGVEAYNLFKDLDIKIIIPKKRINYITSKSMKGIKEGGSPFHSVWITYGIPSISKVLNYV